MVFLAVLAFTLLIPATVGAGGGVSFWMDKVTLKCPEKGDWFKQKDSEVVQNHTTTYKYTYKGTKDMYRCEYQDNNNKKYIYKFYIQGKPCENCFELDAWVFAVVIVADVIGTTVVMAIVYKCSTKTSGGPQKTPNPTRPREGIPMTSPYEALSPHTRSNDEYAGINPVINRTG